MFIVDFQASKVRLRQTKFDLMEANSLQVDPKQGQQLDKIDPVDDAQAEELFNTRDWPRRLHLAEPTVGNIEFRTTFGLCNLPAVFFDLAQRNPHTSPNRLNSFSGVQFGIA